MDNGVSVRARRRDNGCKHHRHDHTMPRYLGRVVQRARLYGQLDTENSVHCNRAVPHSYVDRGSIPRSPRRFYRAQYPAYILK